MFFLTKPCSSTAGFQLRRWAFSFVAKSLSQADSGPKCRWKCPGCHHPAGLGNVLVLKAVGGWTNAASQTGTFLQAMVSGTGQANLENLVLAPREGTSRNVGHRFWDLHMLKTCTVSTASEASL